MASRRDIYYFKGESEERKCEIFFMSISFFFFDSIVFKALFVKSSISSLSDGLDGNSEH